MNENVTLSIDLGSSLTKAVWSHSIANCRFLTMEPEILRCAEKHLQHLQTGNLQLSSTQDSWVKLNKNSQDVYAVGFLAQSLCAQNNLQALKSEAALYKILAVVGEIAQSLNSTHLQLNLGVLLPWSEFSDRTQLHQQLSKALKSFWFRGNCYKVELTQWKCLPEGAGITIHRCHGFSGSRVPAMATLVFGYRNTSCLIFERGKLIAGDTSNLGFYRLLEEVQKFTSGQNHHRLTLVLYQLREDNANNQSLIRSLCRFQKPENQQKEAKQITEAIAMARHSYWELVRLWLLSKIPNHIHELVIAGGTSQYLYASLNQHFCEARSYWGVDVQDRIKNELGFQAIHYDGDLTALAYRFVDVYAHHCLQTQARKLEENR